MRPSPGGPRRPAGEAFTRAVAEGYRRVLAIKDEYEVARLPAGATYSDNPFFPMVP